MTQRVENFVNSSLVDEKQRLQRRKREADRLIVTNQNRIAAHQSRITSMQNLIVNIDADIAEIDRLLQQ